MATIGISNKLLLYLAKSCIDCITSFTLIIILSLFFSNISCGISYSVIQPIAPFLKASSIYFIPLFVSVFNDINISPFFKILVSQQNVFVV